MHRRITLAALAALMFASGPAPAATDATETLLRSLIGKDQAAVERQFGLPDATQYNGVQTFLIYHNFDAWRTTGTPEPFGYSQGYSGPLGLRGSAVFECTTTLVFTEGILRAYARHGSYCRR
ncbi:MAG TPA: hypothetical protein VMU82_14485 [Acetobacteraceae bacterium]|nr:hypothetical protein [Acetobacteraceae bacterium]